MNTNNLPAPTAAYFEDTTNGHFLLEVAAGLRFAATGPDALESSGESPDALPAPPRYNWRALAGLGGREW